MKRIISLFLSFCLVISAGCSSTDIKTYTNEAGDRIRESDRGLMISPGNYPVEIPYNDTSVWVDEVSLYRENYNHGYDLYALVVLDMNGFDSDAQHWLIKEDLSFLFACRSEQNDCSATIMQQLGSTYVQTMAKYIFLYRMPGRAYRYDFSDALVAGAVKIRQTEKYTTKVNGKTVTLHKSNDLMASLDGASDLPTLDQMNSTYYSYVKRWI